MARTALTYQKIVPAGLATSFAAANADGHSLAYRKDGFVVVKQGTGNRDVTIKRNRVVDGYTVPDRTITVAANTERAIAFTDVNVQSDGTIHLDFDAVTNTTIAALYLDLGV